MTEAWHWNKLPRAGADDDAPPKLACGKAPTFRAVQSSRTFLASRRLARWKRCEKCLRAALKRYGLERSR